MHFCGLLRPAALMPRAPIPLSDDVKTLLEFNFDTEYEFIDISTISDDYNL